MLIIYIMTIVQPILTSEQITQITNYVNNYRNLNHAPPLTWDTDMAVVSGNWSNYLLTNNLFQHSGSPLYGENLAYFQGYGMDVMTLLKLAVDSWYNEISSYDFSKPGFSPATGHFTCLVWSASTKFSIGLSIDDKTSATDIVFNTSPPGNVSGQYETNVLPVQIPNPLPIPNPPTPPIPVSEHGQIMNIINDLYNVIVSITRRKPIYFTISLLNNIIIQVSHLTTLQNSSAIINTLTGVINDLPKRRYNVMIINTLNTVINQLKLSF